MLRKNFCIVTLLIFLLATLLYPAGSATEAAGSISVFGNATLPGNSVDLGYMIIEVPPGALSQGDTLSMTLPEGFSFDTSEQVFLSSSLGNIGQSVVSVVYPPAISGKQNALSGNVTANYSGSSTLVISVSGNPPPEQQSIVYIYFKGINTPSNYNGEVSLKLTSNGGWPTSLSDSLGYDYIKENREYQNPDQPKEPEPSQTPNRINAVFKIGEMSFSTGGKPVLMDVAPFIKNGRTYVPVRYIANAVGITDDKITYQSGEITIKYEDTAIALKPGSDVMSAGGRNIKMDVPVLLENGRTYLPIRWVCEALNLKVTWVEESQSIVVENQ